MSDPHGKVGRRMSFAEAIARAKQIRERAERERREYAEVEAASWMQWDDDDEDGGGEQ